MKKLSRKLSALLLALCLIASLPGLGLATTIEAETGLEQAAKGITEKPVDKPVKELPVEPLEPVEDVPPEIAALEAEFLKQQIDPDEQTDRFIVKYKSGAQASLSVLSKAESSMQSSVQSSTDALESSSTDALKSSALLRLTENVVDVLAFEAADGNRMEALVFNDLVDTSSYVAQLSIALAGEIEYIQPDYKINFSSVGLKLEEEPGGEPQPGIPGAPVETEEPEPTQSPKTTQPPEPTQTPEHTETPEPAQTPEPTQTPAPMVNPLTTTAQAEPVIVAVIDSGVDITHPGIAPWIYENPREIAGDGIDNDGNGFVDDVSGWDFVNNSPAVFNTETGLNEMHGTQVASIVAGVLQDAMRANATVNHAPEPTPEPTPESTPEQTPEQPPEQTPESAPEQTLEQIAEQTPAQTPEQTPEQIPEQTPDNLSSNAAADKPEIWILPLKAFEDGKAYTSDIIAAIEYAKNMGAQIINASFGCAQDNRALMEAIEDSGALFVAAAGNARANLEEAPVYPASYALDNVIAVASLNADGGLSYYSNYSERIVDISAQGRDVNCALPGGGYMPQSGTSMSAPYVSGVAAVAAAMHGGADTAALKELLLGAADNLSNLSGLVAENRRVSLENVINGVSGSAVSNTPEDDFDVRGYAPTPVENYELFSNLELIQIEGGNGHTVALASNGTVWSWGANDDSQLGIGSAAPQSINQVVGLTGVVQISTGDDYTLAVKADGTVWGWGDASHTFTSSYNGTKSVPVQLPIYGVTEVDAGFWHVLARKGSTVYVWGQYTFDTISAQPRTIGITDAAQMAAGTFTNFVVTNTGAVKAWGWNGTGIIGIPNINNETDHPNPVLLPTLTGIADIKVDSKVLVLKSNGSVLLNIAGGQYTDTGLTNVASIAIGYSHYLALKTDGTVWAWGVNSVGQVGDGTMVDVAAPVQVEGRANIEHIGAGSSFSLAIDEGGQAWGWGSNAGKQLGDGNVDSPKVLGQIVGLDDVIALSAGNNFSLAVKQDGTVWSWGNNGSGQLGDGTRTAHATPAQIQGLTNVAAVAAGSNSSLALKSDGTVWAWGNNQYGQLGDNTTVDKLTPVQVTGLTDVQSIALRDEHCVALKTDGTVWTWGANSSGQLGDGTTTNRSAPVQVGGLTGVQKIAAGALNTIVLKGNGSVWACGAARSGALGNGSKTDSVVPVQVTGMTGVQDISVGLYHAIARKSDGTMWGWGYGYQGILGDGVETHRYAPVHISTLSNVQRFYCGGFNSAAIKNDGTVWGWGSNNSGELGITPRGDYLFPTQLAEANNAIQIALGGNFILVLKADGTIYSSNGSGQPGPSNPFFLVPTPFVALPETPELRFERPFITLEIPGEGDFVTFEYRANAYGYLGAEPNAQITYSLAAAYEGVSINEINGELMVTGAAAPGEVGIVAQYGGLSATAVAELVRTEGLFFQNAAQSKTIPLGSNTQTVTFAASGMDEEGAELTGISYSLSQEYTGISINSETGEVTITSAANPGELQVLAQSGEYEATAVLTLIPVAEGAALLTLNVTTGKAYHISIVGADVQSFAGSTIRLEYDAGKLSVVDTAAQIEALHTAVGAIAGTDITISSIRSGEITITSSKAIPAGKTWAGILSVLKFQAIDSGPAAIAVSTEV